MIKYFRVLILSQFFRSYVVRRNTSCVANSALHSDKSKINSYFTLRIPNAEGKYSDFENTIAFIFLYCSSVEADLSGRSV
jgi:hypothetical protein